MKKYLFMAVAAIAALSSCSNEDEIVATENGKGETTFFATMENDATTRVTLNDKTPSWESGDVISIDGHDYTAAADVASTGKFTGTGATESTHKAYYPASMYNAGTVTLPASYTYTADKFDMPMYAESTTTTLPFKNLCGVLAITVPASEMSEVSSIVVSSDKQMNGAISSITDAGVLTFASATLTDAEKKVTLTASSAVTITTSVTFYVPVPAGTHNPLKIAVSDGTTKKMMITKKTGGVEVARNKIYPITFADNAVEISADYDNDPLTPNTSLKWAKMNVGATAENNWGDYFAWGETTPRYTGYTRTGDNISFAGWNSNHSSGYASTDAPTYSGATLDAAHDAATANWGGTWRMPTKDEFQAMYNATTWKWDSTDKGYYVYIDEASSSDKSNALLFFPAAGYVKGASLHFGGTGGCYWSSSLSTSDADKACDLYFAESFIVEDDYDNRYYGFTVRPVSE